MEPASKKAFHKVISLCLRTGIITLACWFIYSKVFHHPGLSSFPDLSFSFGAREIFLLVISFAMMFLNWGLEIVKWKMLVSSRAEMSWKRAGKGVLAGLAISIATPNRAGEFAGRIFFLDKQHRVEGMYLSLAGSAAQLFVTLFTAALAALFIKAGWNAELLSRNGTVHFIALIALLAFSFCMLLLFLLPYLLKDTAASGSKWIAAMDGLNRLGLRMLSRVTMISFLRYFIFFLQFHFLLNIFHAEISLHETLVLIPLTFFAISVIPTVAFTEVGLRGTAAVLLLGPFCAQPSSAMEASFVLWVMNVAVPALIGCFFIPSMKIFSGT
ncbi:MAG TPA: lysylphosphatidylglycerol synthase domain-containing protein [Bacteroidia bacterium]